MNQEELDMLLDRYLNGTCTPEEAGKVNSYFNAAAEKSSSMGPVHDLETRKARVWNSLGVERSSKPKLSIRLTYATAIAAAVATIVFGVWLFRYEIASEATQPRNDGLVANDIAPGKYGATITLANGQVIQLDSAKRGVVVGEELTYDDGSSLRAGEAARQSLTILTATTAKGQTYTFTLPDGTKVWLNADSKLEFPMQFSGKERRVLLRGEGYFVVKHNARQPFFVESTGKDGKGQVVEDIGTEFNISAYADDASIKTTLVEGAASVSPLLSGSSLRAGEAATNQARHSDDRRNLLNSKDKRSLATLEMTGKRNDCRGSVTLTPNQQATLSNGSLDVKTVNAEDAVAWKDGKYRFENASLEEVMRQLARWYNIEVQYDGPIPERRFSGGIDRRSNLSTAIAILKNLDISFELKGRTITIRNHS
ncbi:FecR domain-containing protein [Pedobacter sp. JY14-1]|uniref:FecR family protein n=1 Tax=Pedobacter sp. JY14-1 TaxID=3034151 RepID=UPI0023E263D0|nr:FecR domain-containing protein [Pedobacter sp. JY14-1]